MHTFSACNIQIEQTIYAYDSIYSRFFISVYKALHIIYRDCKDSVNLRSEEIKKLSPVTARCVENDDPQNFEELNMID